MICLKALLNLCFKKSYKHIYKIFNQSSTFYLVYSFCFIIFIIEILTYCCMVFFWHQIKCYNDNECTKILLVADPQIIGLHNERYPKLTSIAIWDSDWYLYKTFWKAHSFIDPDVIVFLGDLLDEGSSANDKEFNLYIKRFYNIFQKHDNSLYIWNSGDNDIGGEFPDFLTNHKVKRFNRAFLQPDVISYRDIKFFKINMFLNTMPIASESTNVTKHNIVLSHVPLLVNPSLFVDKILDTLNPKLLLAAHTHKSMVVTTRRDSRQNRFISPITPANTDIYTYMLDSDKFIEIVVPTCSYRMGTTKIGYGFAVLESGTVHYTVLWSPSRFLQLIIYGIYLLLVLLYGLYKCTKKTKKNHCILPYKFAK